MMLNSPQDCCRPCPEATTTDIPGPQGPAGADGTNGTDGINAYTTVTVPFLMPGYGLTVDVTVASSAWAAVGQAVFLGLASSAAKGTFQVAAIPDATTLTLTNLADGASAYVDNSGPGTLFPILTQVSPAGFEGATGSPGSSGAPTDATYITQTPNATLTNEQALSALATGIMKSTTATGVVTTIPIDTTNGGQAPNDGALTNGDAVFGTATGIQTKSAANARTALGLGTMATQNANAVNITGGSISGVTGVGVTGSGCVQNWMVYQNQQASGTDGGDFTQGSWITVPLNTEVIDTGNDGTIAANVVTLAAGTYRFRWRIPAFSVDEFQTRLVQGVATVIAYGTSEKSASTDASQTASTGWWRATVIAGTQIRLEARCTLTKLTSGFGLANGWGGTEIFGTLEIEKEA